MEQIPYVASIRTYRALQRPASALRGCMVFAVLLFLNGCSDGQDENTGAVLSGEFLALSYNVAGLPDVLSKSNPAVNTPLISPLLNGYDLVLVQEDWETPVPNTLAPLRVYHELLEEQALHHYRSESAPLPLRSDPARPEALMSDGLNRFSEFPFGGLVRQRWAGCDNNSGDCLALKGFSVARTELAPGICVDVYNVHGEAGNNPGDHALKEENTQALVAFVELFSAGRAVIIGGDFNLRRRRSPDVEYLDFLTMTAGVTNACSALGIVDEEAIDKFFFRSNDTVTLTPASCRFETDIFIAQDGKPLSDHDPLAVGFIWSGSPSTGVECL